MTKLLQGRRSALQASAFIAGLFAAALSSSAAVTANIVASRTSGVAPLAVNFDATGTTSGATTRPFHDVYYSWNYGDTSSGAWGTDGKSKNHDTGPIGGHVFESPGTYTVTLTAKDSSGATDTKTATITVSDPNTIFSGANTICISTTADFTGAPSGALQVTTTSWSTVVSNLGTGKRVLLHRGQSWNHNSAKKDLTFNGPAELGAFGSGARPIIRLVSSDQSNGGRVFWFGTGSTPNQFNDFRFMDLEIDGAGFDRGFAWSEGACHNITLLRVYMHNGGQLLFLSPDIYTYYNSQPDPAKNGHLLPSGIAIIDTQFDTMVGDGTEFNKHHIAYVGMHRALFLGNVWNNTQLGEHVFRLPFVQRTIIAHNELTNTRVNKHLIKLHAIEGMDTLVSPPGNGQSKFVTIADNTFTSAKGNWLVSTGPQNNTSDEVVQDIIIERNHVQFGGESTTAFDLRGSDHTVRNNTVIMTGSPFAGTVAVFAPRGIEPPPANNRVYNNSAFRNDTLGFTFVSINSAASNTTVQNNLASAPNATTKTMISGSGTGLVQSNNSLTNTPGWVTAIPTAAADFELAAGSAAIDAGTTTPVFDDYDEAPRPLGTARDIGAFEFIPTPVITIVASDASAGEPSNNGQFTVTATPAPIAPLTVNLSRSGTATNGTDYVSIPTTVTIPTSGSATIPVTVIDDATVESSETVTLTVTSASGYTVGSPSSATVTITDNDVANLLSFGTFEPDQATVLSDMPSPYVLGTGALNKWQGRVGTGVQQTTYQTSGTNHYVTVGTSVNTNGCFQVVVWPGAGSRTVSYQYQGTGSFVKIFGGNTGNSLNKFDGGNTLTLITQINNATAASWTNKSQTVTLTGTYNYLVIQLRGGDFDNVSVGP